MAETTQTCPVMYRVRIIHNPDENNLGAAYLTAESLLNLKTSLDSFAKVVLDNCMVLDYMLAEQMGILCFCKYILLYLYKTSPAETSMEKSDSKPPSCNNLQPIICQFQRE